MTEIDPVWLAMVLGAYANIVPPSFIRVRHGDSDPDKAYIHLKQAIREKTSIQADILDIGPGSAERRQILAEQLRQADINNDPVVWRWAITLLESTLNYAPRTIFAAGFSPEDVRKALQALYGKQLVI